MTVVARRYSPVAILYDANGVAMAVENGVAIPLNTRGLVFAGRDGSGAARFVAVDASGRVLTEVSNFPATQAVTGPLTDAQLRATPVPVAGTFSSDGLTDGELRASPVPVSGPLTDTQLRAAAVPVSAASLPLPSGAATQATLSAVLIELGQKTEPADQQHVLVDNFPATQPVSGTVAVSNFPATQVVSGPLTDAQLRAVAVPVSGFPAVQPVSDNGGSLTIDGAVTVSNFPATQPVSGPLTDTQLRAAAVPVSGPLTDAQLRAAPVPVSGTVSTGGLTDSQLRASPVPVSGSVSTGGLTNAELRASAVPVSGPLTNTELRAVAVPVSAASLPLPTGAATQATVAAILARQSDGTQHTIVDNFPAVQPVSGALTNAELRATSVPVSQSSQPLPTGASTEATLAAIKAKTDNLDVALSTRAVTGLTDGQLRAAPVPVTGTVSTGGLTDAELRATAVPVSAATLPLPTGAATQATLAAAAASLANIDTDLDVALSTRATEATLALIKAKTDNLDVALSTRAVTGLTDAQLRAAAVPVSGPATDAQLRATPLPVSGPLTDTQLRATPVPVSGTVSTGGLTDTQLRATPVPVSGTVSTGGLTDTQLRASAVPVSAAALPLPAGAATEATLALIKAKTDNLDVALSTRAVTGLTDGQLRATPVAVDVGGLTSWAVGQVAVALTAVQIAVTPLTNRRTISLKAMCFVDTLGVSDRIFVGPNNTVSTTNGFGLSNGETIDLDLGPGATLWAVSDASRSPTNGVYVLEIAG